MSPAGLSLGGQTARAHGQRAEPEDEHQLRVRGHHVCLTEAQFERRIIHDNNLVLQFYLLFVGLSLCAMFTLFI